MAFQVFSTIDDAESAEALLAMCKESSSDEGKLFAAVALAHIGTEQSIQMLQECEPYMTNEYYNEALNEIPVKVHPRER